MLPLYIGPGGRLMVMTDLWLLSGVNCHRMLRYPYSDNYIVS